MVLPAHTTREIVRGASQYSTQSRQVSVVMNIETRDADSFMRSQTQIQARLQTALTRASSRNN
jgi:hypothetical protein